MRQPSGVVILPSPEHPGPPGEGPPAADTVPAAAGGEAERQAPAPRPRRGRSSVRIRADLAEAPPAERGEEAPPGEVPPEALAAAEGRDPERAAAEPAETAPPATAERPEPQPDEAEPATTAEETPAPRLRWAERRRRSSRAG